MRSRFALGVEYVTLADLNGSFSQREFAIYGKAVAILAKQEPELRLAAGSRLQVLAERFELDTVIGV